MESRVWRVLVVVALVLALAAGLFGVLLPKAAVVPQFGPVGETGSRSFATYLSSLTVGGTTVLEGNTTVSGTLELADAVDLADDLVVAGDLAVDGDGVITGTLGLDGGRAMVTGLVTNGVGITNSVTGASNGLVFEGATADAYEITLTAADAASSDKSITLPDVQGEVMVSPGYDAAGGWFAAGQDFKYEGSTANEHEAMFRAPGDPAADAIYSLPTYSGYVAMNSADNVKLVWGSSVVTGTATLTHGLTTPLYAFCSMGADPVDNEEDRCTVLISGATVTAKVWKEATSPTAGDSGVIVYWVVAGTP